MRFLHLLALLGTLHFVTTVQGGDIISGEQLHAENCMRCHQAEMYTRPDSKINSFIQLRKRVRQCELANELAWFDQEVDDVTAYLNASYYLFDMK